MFMMCTPVISNTHHVMENHALFRARVIYLKFIVWLWIFFAHFHYLAVGVDYIQLDTILTFAPCEPMVCGVVRALDDCVLEKEETFNISLTIPSGQDPRIRIDRGHGVVTIVDTDSMHS